MIQTLCHLTDMSHSSETGSPLFIDDLTEDRSSWMNSKVYLADSMSDRLS